jgi:hypothetical protein
MIRSCGMRRAVLHSYRGVDKHRAGLMVCESGNPCHAPITVFSFPLCGGLPTTSPVVRHHEHDHRRLGRRNHASYPVWAMAAAHTADQRGFHHAHWPLFDDQNDWSSSPVVGRPWLDLCHQQRWRPAFANQFAASIRSDCYAIQPSPSPWPTATDLPRHSAPHLSAGYYATGTAATRARLIGKELSLVLFSANGPRPFLSVRPSPV